MLDIRIFRRPLPTAVIYYFWHYKSGSKTVEARNDFCEILESRQSFIVQYVQRNHGMEKEARGSRKEGFIYLDEYHPLLP